MARKVGGRGDLSREIRDIINLDTERTGQDRVGTLLRHIPPETLRDPGIYGAEAADQDSAVPELLVILAAVALLETRQPRWEQPFQVALLAMVDQEEMQVHEDLMALVLLGEPLRQEHRRRHPAVVLAPGLGWAPVEAAALGHLIVEASAAWAIRAMVELQVADLAAPVDGGPIPAALVLLAFMALPAAAAAAALGPHHLELADLVGQEAAAADAVLALLVTQAVQAILDQVVQLILRLEQYRLAQPHQ